MAQINNLIVIILKSMESKEGQAAGESKDNGISQLEQLKQNFKDLGLDPNSTQVSRQTFPLLYDVGSRVGMGTSAGFAFGMVFFKKWPVRRFTTMFGLGVGLGLNYSQLRVLWHAASGTFDASS